jgi:cell division protein FtsZ
VINLFPSSAQPDATNNEPHASAGGGASESSESSALEAGWRDAPDDASAPEGPDAPEASGAPETPHLSEQTQTANAESAPAADAGAATPSPTDAHDDELNTPTGGARLLVVGVGGAGCNIVNHMIESDMSGVEFLTINTDTQALRRSLAANRLTIGATLTRGMGTGGNPAIGQQVAQESYHELVSALDGADMVFITAGMGGGTGTGACPIVAQAAREVGALTLAIVTTPFAFERRRRSVAEQGVAALRTVVDALIMVPNERLAQLVGRDTSIFEAYRLADEALRVGVQGLSDLITIPGLVNLDFADVRSVMSEAGSAYLASGSAKGDGRAENALRSALSNPLLDVDITGARGLIFNVTGGDDLSMREVEQIANALSASVHPDANLIFGATYDPKATDTLKLTVVATGFEPHVAPEARPSTWTPGRIPLAPSRRENRPDVSAAGAPSRPAEPSTPGRMVFDEPLPHLSQPGADYNWNSPPASTWSAPSQTPSAPGWQGGVSVTPVNPPTSGQPVQQPPNQPTSQQGSQPANQPLAGVRPPATGRPQGGSDQVVNPAYPRGRAAYPREDYAENVEETSHPQEREDRQGFWSRLFSSSPSRPAGHSEPPDTQHP